MPRVLVLNNYPLDAVWDQVRRGETPDHVLFGVNHFAKRGYEYEFVPCEDGAPARGIDRLLAACRFPLPLGNIERQKLALRRAGSADVIYAACEGETALLACMRAAGMLKVPIVSVVHHPPNRGRLARLRTPFFEIVNRGTDAFPCLSRRVAEEIGSKAVALPWGPDPAFYPPSGGPGCGIVTCGRTGRDFVTFGRAATLAGVPARIICLERDVTPAFREFGANVEVLPQPATGWMKYPELNRLMADARAVAIPLARQESLAGLTSLMDALGLGRPVIMTCNPFIDLDVEAEGIGRLLDPGDVHGWRDAMRWFDAHPAEAAAMGERARRLVDGGFNSAVFAERIMDIFDRLLNKP